jgi:TatD DNase family protein
VKAFVGVHPSEALVDPSLDWLVRALPKATGAGEVGLDPRYSATDSESAQMRAFLTQLEAAQGQRKPVQVHSRDAGRECLDALGGFTLKSVLMHWFQDEETLPAVSDRGYFVSFGPAVLYSKKLQRMASRCDPNQVLAETDSPTTYGPLRGAHGPFLIPSVLFRLAELWGTRFEEVRQTIAENNRRYLSCPRKVNHGTRSGLKEVGQDTEAF